MALTALIRDFPSIYRPLWSFTEPGFGEGAGKPPAGASVRINKNHPDAKGLELFWLFSEPPGSPVAFEYAGPHPGMVFELGTLTTFAVPFSTVPNITGILSTLANSAPGDFVSVGGAIPQPKFDLSNGFTIELLMSITDASAETVYLTLGPNIGSRAVSLARGTSGEDRFYMSNDGTAIVTAAGGGGTAGNSVHAVWDGTNMKVYSNGVLQATQANANAPFVTSGQEWVLMKGSWFSGTGACGGTLLYGGVWSRPMSAEEVLSRLDTPFDMFQTPPLFTNVISAEPPGPDPGPGPGGGGLSGDVDICSLL